MSKIRLIMSHVLQIACACAVFAVTSVFGEQVMDVFKKLDQAYSAGDPIALIRLAAELEGKDLWSFGDGGPTDTASLRMRVFVAAEDLLFKRGNLTNVLSNVANADLNEPQRRILAVLTTNPHDTKRLGELLNSGDPSLRWIGLFRVRSLATPPSSILAAVSQIASNDTFVIIDKIPKKLRQNAPAPPGLSTKAFVAPLRTMAQDQLLKWNQSVVDNNEEIIKIGWQRLLRDYVARKDYQERILSGIAELNQASKTKRFLESVNPKTREELEALATFKKVAQVQ